jgi:hypothetical protein
MNRKAVNIMVFSVGLLMLLLRPYVIYRITGHWNTDKNPVKSSLLQRLVKKKDEHYECRENDAVEVRSKKFCFRLPVKRLPSFDFRNLLPAAGFCLAVFAEMAAAIWRIRPGNHRYSLLSCFRI